MGSMKAHQTFCLAAGATLALTACAGTPEVQTGPVAQAVPLSAESFGLQSASVGIGETIVRPKDKIAIAVMGEPELTFDSLTVPENGQFMFPMVGTINAAGRGPDAIAEELRSRLAARYLRNPIVTVNVLEQGSYFVTVEGEVEQPGVFTFRPDTTLLGGIAMARGPGDFAKRSQVILFREINDQMMAARFDLGLLRTGAQIDPILQPGDRIMVGQSGSAKTFDRILQAIPAAAIFTNIANATDSGN